MRIKGEYEAQIIINFCEDAELSLDKIQDNLDKLADGICAILKDELVLSEQSTIAVKKTHANIWEV